MTGHKAPQVGVAVVTVDMFREYQKHVASTFDLQNSQIAVLQERVQALEGRIQSLEDAEDLAIDAVREIRDNVIPRVEQHHQSLDSLSSAVNRQNTILEALGNLGQELRAGQGRDAMRPGQLAWRPGPLGGPTDHIKGTVDEIKTQLTRSFASLAEHDRHLKESDTRLGTHERHLTEHERRFADHEARLAAHERHIGEHNTRSATHFRDFEAHLGAHERLLRENEKRLVEHNERLGALDKTNDLVSSIDLFSNFNDFPLD